MAQVPSGLMVRTKLPVALSMVIVVIGTLFVGRQLLWENAQIQTDRLASTLAAQVAAQRVPD